MLKKKHTHFLSYYLIRVFLYPISFLPYRAVHALGKALGIIAYYFGPSKIRKITFNNLALAKDLKLTEKEIKKIAIGSFQNLIINALEYFRLPKSKNKISRFVKGHNMNFLRDFKEKKQGVIAVTGHISNWELCFLDFTQKGPATAIGKEIRNKKLYNYIQSIRQMHGGKIIEMQKALPIASKALKEGATFSMVNDQSFIASSYSYPFFGARAFTSPAPALLAYKSNCPISIVTTRRLPKGKYEYHISDPIWPNTKASLKQEVRRLMDIIMSKFEDHIKKYPDQWLWQHKRWKQEGFNRVYAQYKADSILFIIPEDKVAFEQVNKALPILRKIYTRSFLTFMIPQKFKNQFSMPNEEVITYQNENDILVRDYRFQLIFDFRNSKRVKKHFLKLGAHSVFFAHQLTKVPLNQPVDVEKLFKSKLCLEATSFE